MSRALRRDAPVTCIICSRQVERRGRLQLYCSSRCRKRGNYAQRVRRGDFSTPTVWDTALGTIPHKKDSKFRALQREKSRSSPHILAPAQVVAVEVFGGAWHEATSSDGVAIQTRRIRPRGLVTSAAHALGDAQRT